MTNYNLAVSEDRLNKDNVLLVGENSCFPPHPFSAFERFDCAPARRVPHSVRSVSPDGDEGAALDSQGGRVPLDSRFWVDKK